jgi:hypothetical protein
MSDTALREYRAALANLESALATAAQAAQTHRLLLERAESGEPVPDSELDEAAEIARQTAAEAATAEGVARGPPSGHDGTQGHRWGSAAALPND